MCEKKDFWDKADILSKWLMPSVLAIATFAFNHAVNKRTVMDNNAARERAAMDTADANERAAREKRLAVAIGILQTPSSPDNKWMKAWALPVFVKETGFSFEATDELKSGTLPATSKLSLPNPGQPRVSIIQLEETPSSNADRIRWALIDAGYKNATITVRPLGEFPENSEVRFYYPTDGQNARSLSNYINRTLSLETRVSDKSQDRDASVHRPRDLHVYIR